MNSPNRVQYITYGLGKIYSDMYFAETMATGPGSFHNRRVQLTGGATYTVSLPKDWAQAYSIKEKDTVKMEWRPSGSLMLSPAQQKEVTRREISLMVDDIPVGSLVDHLVAAYIASTDRIRLHAKDGFSREHMSRIRRFIKMTAGFEIMEETDTSMDLLNLLNVAEMPIQSSINRMYLQLTSIIRDIADVFSGEDVSLLEDVDDRERELDSIQLFIERQVGALLESHRISNELDIDRRRAVQMANLAKAFERMGDHATQFAHLIINTENRPILEMTEAPLNQLAVWQNALKSLMLNIRTENPEEIHEARMSLKNSQMELQQYEDSLWEMRASTTTILFDYRVSEIIRRLCAYSRDVGETLLNILACKGVVNR